MSENEYSQERFFNLFFLVIVYSQFSIVDKNINFNQKLDKIQKKRVKQTKNSIDDISADKTVYFSFFCF